MKKQIIILYVIMLLFFLGINISYAGKIVPISDTSQLNGSLQITNNQFVISTKYTNGSLVPYAKVNGIDISFNELTGVTLSQVSPKLRMIKINNGYKFAFNLTKIATISEVGFMYKGFDYNKEAIFNQYVYIDFNDLLKQGYTVTINDTYVKITNLKNGFNDLDPIITFLSNTRRTNSLCDFASTCDGVLNLTVPLYNSNNSFLFVSVSYSYQVVGSGVYVESIDYGGVPLIYKDQQVVGAATTEIWYMNKSLQFTNNSNTLVTRMFNDGGSSFYSIILAEQFDNVNQTNPILQTKSATGASSPVKCLINGTNETNMLVDFPLADRGTSTLTLTKQGLQTQIDNAILGAGSVRSIIASSWMYANITTFQNNMSWTESTNRNWATYCYELKYTEPLSPPAPLIPQVNCNLTRLDLGNFTINIPYIFVCINSVEGLKFIRI